ncbi:ABC transporter ATP-binding protein [Xanthomonas maliensis]|uniref:ABC transporter ATP-binding protein n=1 Tax=Xanthomonas maliensis TaxID=1321368 RepID=UPI0003A0AAC9|nr:ABC transporter ATP-binding protein [Xanthomonas maliensis]KAB7766233.1 ABC transporter ATP-binding protein [Xanthomonas maliensis]
MTAIAVSVPATEPLIRLHGLSKVFHTDEVETHALAEIALEVERGDFIAITGPSGCGKSTLLSILGLLDAPSSGSYQLNGRRVAELDAVGRARIRNAEIGFIFQAFNLIADLTVEENVALPLTYRDGAERGRIRQRVREVLELVGMHHRHKHYPGQLSGGQQQRVAVARALAGNPSILLADEPTGNLDSHNGEAVMQLLEQLHDNGTTLCMVTHDGAFARRAQRIVHMLDGRIVDEDSFERLRHAQDITLPLRPVEQAR